MISALRRDAEALERIEVIDDPSHPAHNAGEGTGVAPPVVSQRRHLLLAGGFLR